MSWKQTVVVLSAATSAPLIAANPQRFGLRWQNIGANPMTVAPGVAAAVVGQGMAYAAAEKADFLTQEDTQDAWTAISTLGTTIIVWENVPAGGILPANSGV